MLVKKKQKRETMNFTVISFEVANIYKNSACSLYIIKVKKNLILTEKSFLIKPPTKWFPFSEHSRDYVSIG